jgi:hypothetical protein
MAVVIDGTTGITTPGVSNSGTMTQTGAATMASTLQTATTIGVGAATPAASGAGITFPATQSASSDANTLDDYEEGTYTPTLATSTGTPTYQYQEGRYTKIGNVVVCGGIIGITNSASLTGTINVSLPFASNNTTYGVTAGTSSDGSGFTWPISSSYCLNFSIGGGAAQSYAAAINVGPSPSSIAYNSAGVANSWFFRFKFVYVVA